MLGEALPKARTGTWRIDQTSPISSFARTVLGFTVAASALCALVATALLAYGWYYSSNGRTFQGVEVAGVELGGLSRAEAEQRIAQRIESLAPDKVVLEQGETTWTIPVESLGVSYDAAATADAAYHVGRSGNLWNTSRDWLLSLLRGHEIDVVYQVNEAPAVATLEGLAPEITRQPHDARYIFDDSGKLVIEPARPGVGIDVSRTLTGMRAGLADLSADPVPIQTVEVKPATDAKMLQPGLDKAAAMVEQPFELHYRGSTWQVSPESLKSMLTIVDGGKDKPQVMLRADALESYLAPLKNEAKTDGQNADVRWDSGRFVVVPSVAGEQINIRATVERALAALEDDRHEIDVAVTTAPAAVTDADAQTAAQRANGLVDQPFTLTWSNGTAELTPEQIARAVIFSAQSNASDKLRVDLDTEKLVEALSAVKPQIEVQAKDAQLRYYDGAVHVVAAEQPGLALDAQQTANAMREALTNGRHTAAAVTAPVQPQVTAASAESIQIRERLTAAETYYGGSVANRKFNVELAVERANGALVPPGGTYSFTESVGAIDIESGYKVGYGIVATSSGSVSTVPSVGGGVCQVSTTLFHTIFWAGMPIVERNWHLYWIPLYGQPPMGLKGLDATVDTDYGLDLKFKNTTDNWLAVVASANGSAVRFELWGTDPGWDVQVDKPVVTNVVAANQAMQYEQSNQLPAGQSVFVEHAEDGFDVSIHRVVRKDDAVLDDLTLRSHYVPSSNVTLVGTG